MEDFLNVLKLQLMDRLPPGELEEQIALYRDYIEKAVAGGTPEEEVLSRLGDPAKVADLIVQHRTDAGPEDMTSDDATLFGWKRDMTEEEVNAQVENPERGIHAEFKENEGWDVRLGNLKLNGWTGTLIILGIVLVIFIVISLLMNR